MPSVSKSQQRLMGMAYAVKSGDMEISDIDPAYRDKVKSLSDGMTKKDLKKYASTKHEDLPETVDENFETANARISPDVSIGGMGAVSLPNAENGNIGSGDVPSVADIDDDEEEAKKDKTKKKLEMEGFKLFTQFNNFIAESSDFDKIYEEAVLENAVRDLHFEIDADKAEDMKIAIGASQGEVTRRKQIEGGNYSLRRFRKEIKYDETGEDLGVFKPGSYMAATSKLGDGPHKKAVKKIKWNQKMYNQWLEDVASNGGWEHAFDMAQNAKHERGLIDWVKKNHRGEDPMQRIQWDIEAFAESVVTEKLARDLKPLLILGSILKKNAGEDTLLDLSDKFDALGDEDADNIASYLNMAIELMQDGYGKSATEKLKQFNKACKDALAGKEVGSAFESVVTEAKGFKNTTDFEKFLIEIDGMRESQIKKIMGKDYIDTPGFYQDEKGNYDNDIIDFMISNMGDSEFEKLKSWWENNVAESVVNEKSWNDVAKIMDAGLKTAVKKGITTLRYAKDYVKSLERMANKEAKKFFDEYGDFSEDDFIEDVRYNMANEKVKDHFSEWCKLNEAKSISREEMTKWIEKYMRVAGTSEEFNGGEGGIWVSGEDSDEYKGNLIYSYYSEGKAFELGVNVKWEKELNKRGWYSEWYDAGTIQIWPI